MKAVVRLSDGHTERMRIVNVENDGSGDYGYALFGSKRIPVSQSTTIQHADGSIEKCWDEIIQTPYTMKPEEDW